MLRGSRSSLRGASGTLRRTGRLLTKLTGQRALVGGFADALAWAVGILVALWWRFEFTVGNWPMSDVATAIALAVLLQIGFGLGLGLYRGRWRTGSFEEVAAVTQSITLVTLVLQSLNVAAFEPRLLPLSVVVGGAVLALVFMVASRYMWRILVERQLRPSSERARPVLVYGAGEGGAQIITAMLRNPDSPYLPVGLIDDSAAKQQLRIMGVSVLGGRDRLEAVASELGVDMLIVAIPSASSDLLRQLSALALQADLEVRTLPPIHRTLGGTVGLDDLRPIDEADLLGRHEIRTEVSEVAQLLRGRRVLVTGAGGSIGSELCRQINGFVPDRLIMLDRDESALHAVQLSITGRAMLESPNLVVADIRDRERLNEVFHDVRPHVVFHAAALKHLPLLEQHPDEGLKTNVMGTLHVLDAAVAAGVDRFVNVSTDKAARPENVLGYTKRIAERLTANKSQEAPGAYLSVRFGNVLGSRGSVLETFRAQIARGGPVTVTHPDVTRYFMTVEEAVQLVMQAAAIGDPGEVLVLDMGEPVRIDDVARRLIAESNNPVEIEYTGLRHGEKLHEELLNPGEVDRRPHHPLISHVDAPVLARSELYQVLGEGGLDITDAMRVLCQLPRDPADITSVR